MSQNPFREADPVAESASAILEANSRVVINDVPSHQRSGVTRFGHYVVGGVTFGSVSVPRDIVIDEDWKLDKKLCGGAPCARIANQLTEIKNGYVTNATLAKFNLNTGIMWLAEDEDESGNIVWGRPFKFKRLYVTNVDRVNKAGWGV